MEYSPANWSATHIQLLSACLSQLKHWGKSRRLAHVVNIFVPIKDAIYYAAQAESTTGLSHTELLDSLD